MQQVKITKELLKSFLETKSISSQGIQEFHLHCMESSGLLPCS